MKVAIYIEGAGNLKAQKQDCRRAFRAFLSPFSPVGCAPKLIPCGSRRNAYDKFRTALRDSSIFPILLVDSEAPVAKNGGPWAHFRKRQGDNWDKPEGVTDDHAHMMVQCMESWFLADKDRLADYFGRDFSTNALPARTDIETIAKSDVYRALDSATHDCKKTMKGKSGSKGKGKYGKGAHSFDILAGLDPQLVRKASPHAARFFDTLKLKLEN